MNEGKTIQSVQRAIDIINCFIESDVELSLNAISSKLNLNKSTVHGLIATLCKNGYIQQQNNAKYVLGEAILSKGAMSKESNIMLLRDIIRNYQDAVTQKYAATTSSFFSEGHTLYLAYQSLPAESYYVASNFVDSIPFYCTASGKLLLAHMSESVLRDYCAAADFVSYTSKTITNRTLLLKEIKKIQKERISCENQEHQIDVYSISVPIYRQDIFFGTFSLTGTLHSIIPRADAIVSDLVNIAKKVSSELGAK